MGSVNIFSERYKQDIYNKRIEVSLFNSVRKQLYNFMNKYDCEYNHYDTVFEKVQEAVKCFYDLSYGPSGKTIIADSYYDFLMQTYPTRVFDAIEVFSDLISKEALKELLAKINS